MVWKGSEAAGNQIEQSCEEAWKSRENPNTKREERIRQKSKRSKRIGNRWKWKGGRKKSSYWTRAMAWLQQLAPDVTMKLQVIYQRIPTHTHTHTHTYKSIIRKRVSPKTRHRVPKVRTQQPTTTHQHKCRIMDQSF